MSSKIMSAEEFDINHQPTTRWEIMQDFAEYFHAEQMKVEAVEFYNWLVENYYIDKDTQFSTLELYDLFIEDKTKTK